MLVDVDPSGYARFLTDGIARARFHSSTERVESIVSGKVYRWCQDKACDPISVQQVTPTRPRLLHGGLSQYFAQSEADDAFFAGKEVDRDDLDALRTRYHRYPWLAVHQHLLAGFVAEAQLLDIPRHPKVGVTSTRGKEDLAGCRRDMSHVVGDALQTLPPTPLVCLMVAPNVGLGCRQQTHDLFLTYLRGAAERVGLRIGIQLRGLNEIASAHEDACCRRSAKSFATAEIGWNSGFSAQVGSGYEHLEKRKADSLAPPES